MHDSNNNNNNYTRASKVGATAILIPMQSYLGMHEGEGQCSNGQHIHAQLLCANITDGLSPGLHRLHALHIGAHAC